MKKQISVLFFLMLAFAVPAGAVDELSLTGQAAGKYQSRDYAGAAALYEKVIEAGRGSAALFYDLGNAYFKTGQKAKALASYRRAERLAPRDPDIRWNIAILKDTLPDRIDGGSGNIFIVKLNELRQSYSPDEAAWALLGFMIALALGAALKFAPGAAQKFSSALVVIAVTGAAISGLALGLKAAELREPAAVIALREVTAHYGPSDIETKAFVLHEGAEVRVSDETAQWYFIELADHKTGWVPKSACELV